jgi:hypothetical protein
MKRTRLILLALGLAVAFSFSGQKAQAYCQSYGNCELNCLPREEACLNGTLHPECGGDPTCCYNTVARCYECCIWY